MSASRSEPGVESLFVWMLLVGSHEVGAAVTPEGVNRFEAAVDGTDGWAACPLCGDWVRAHGLAGHQAASTRCRRLTAHRAVEDGWAEGWRDPWSQRPVVPSRWSELRDSRWRRFLRVVESPQWSAVQVDPERRLSTRPFPRSAVALAL